MKISSAAWSPEGPSVFVQLVSATSWLWLGHALISDSGLVQHCTMSRSVPSVLICSSQRCPFYAAPTVPANHDARKHRHQAEWVKRDWQSRGQGKSPFPWGKRGGKVSGAEWRQQMGAFQRCHSLLPTSARTHTTNTHTDTGLFSVFQTLTSYMAQSVLRSHLIPV